MTLLFDAFWRAAAYCLHPRVVGLSLLPLVLAGTAAVTAGYFFWEPAVDQVRGWLETWSLVAAMLQWLESIGAAGFRTVLAPMVVVAMALPVVVVLTLLLVAMLMTPAVVTMVAERRFPSLERRRGAGWLRQLGWSAGWSVVALATLAATLPLWLVPPLALVLPPLIWGWLTAKVMTFDVLADHASPTERRRLMRSHRWALRGMGLVAGFLGAAPSLLWAASALTLIFAPLLVIVSIWLYTLVFAFTALWFSHYLLAALAALRPPARASVPPATAAADAPPAVRPDITLEGPAPGRADGGGGMGRGPAAPAVPVLTTVVAPPTHGDAS